MCTSVCVECVSSLALGKGSITVLCGKGAELCVPKCACKFTMLLLSFGKWKSLCVRHHAQSQPFVSK